MPDFLVDFNEVEALAASFLGNGQSLRFQARGKSMRPFIQDGDLVEVQPVPSATIQRGDVLFCRLADGRLVIHRVVQVKPGALRLQGDALLFSDGNIPAENVLGRVDSLTRQGKSIRLNSPWMKLLSCFLLFTAPFRAVLARLTRRINRFFYKRSPLNPKHPL
jgi:hypothetical protein